ncbi:MAG: glycerol-3-phosphate dehydrogenase/oxidase [Nitrosomonas sp.]|nr:MAG: glycerol-3-phosphate dehydrogenase/oxidase [Nitrosomonas sp.]
MKRDFAALASQSYDLLICGGGIYGAWTAFDAALRGLKVALIEQQDWASGTSSASTKLIHGGLRYLETFDIKLVRKALAERTMLLRTAPHRVWPLQFGVPVYARQRLNRLQLKLGLSLYDYLAGDNDPSMRHRYWSAAQFCAHFPDLTGESLKGGFTYVDAQTDDARLVLELIAGAQDAGAHCVNYCQYARLLETDGKAGGAVIRDQLTKSETTIRARQIVFTTGQWLATEPQGRQWCRLAKGTHLIMPAMPHHEALLLTAPADGRVFFLIPWYGLVLLGTTDTDYQGDIDRVAVTDDDIDYLLNAVNHYLKVPWTRADIIGSFAGVRVFKDTVKSAAADSPSSLSRDWTLKTATNGVHYAIGGKITSSRQDAAHIVDTVCAQLRISASCATQNHALPWSPKQHFTAWTERMTAQAVQLGVDPESAHWLLRRHGTTSGEILQQLKHQPELAHRIVPSVPLIHADLMHCARREMIVHLDDLLRRRLPLLILARLCDKTLHHLAQCVAVPLQCDTGRIAQQIARCDRYRHFA